MKALVSYFNAGVDGTDEKDVGEDDEDADVKTKHKCRSVEEKRRGPLGCRILINSS